MPDDIEITKSTPQITTATVRPSWYAVKKKAANDDAVEVSIYDEIGGWGVSAAAFVADIKAINARTINLRLNTPGGSITEGTAIYNALREHPARVVAHVDGLAASAGSFIAMSADEVRMADNAYLMIHNGSCGVMGGAEEHRRYADLLDKMNDNIAGMYEKKTGKPRDHWRALMDAETWFTAEEAKAEGLADAVYAAEPKKDAPAKAAECVKFYNKIPDGARVLLGLTQPTNTPAPEDSPCGDPPPAQLQEKSQMAESNQAAAPTPAANVPPTPAPSPVAAAPAPSTDTLEGLRTITVQQYTERGIASGKLLERHAQQDLMRELVAACPGKPELAINAFLTGQPAASVKLAFDAAQAAERAANARIAQMELEHARALALSAAGGVAGGVPTAVGQSDPSEVAFAPGTPPETQAKMEWDSNFKNCRNTGATENQYTLTRVAQLNGQVRAFAK